MANIYEQVSTELSPYLQKIALDEELSVSEEAGKEWRREKKKEFQERSYDVQKQAEKAAEEAKKSKFLGLNRKHYGNLSTAIKLFVPGSASVMAVLDTVGEGAFARDEAKTYKKGLEKLGLSGFENTFLSSAQKQQNLAIESQVEKIDPNEAAAAGLMAGGLKAGISTAIGKVFDKFDAPELGDLHDKTVDELITEGSEGLTGDASKEFIENNMSKISAIDKAIHTAETSGLDMNLLDIDAGKIGDTDIQKLVGDKIELNPEDFKLYSKVQKVADFNESGSAEIGKIGDVQINVSDISGFEPKATPLKDWFAESKKEYKTATKDLSSYGEYLKGKVLPWTKERQGIGGMYRAFQEGEYSKALGVWEQPIFEELGLGTQDIATPSPEEAGLSVSPYGTKDWMYKI